MSYDDIKEIVEIDKIWKAQEVHWFLKYVVAPPLLVLVVLLAIVIVVVPFLGSAALIVFILGLIINGFITGEDPGSDLFRYLLLALVVFSLSSVFIFSIFWALIHGDSEDLRYLVRFKILPPTGMDSSTHSLDPIEAVLQALKKKRKLGRSTEVQKRIYRLQSVRFHSDISSEEISERSLCS